jgi:hypothetical protein
LYSAQLRRTANSDSTMSGSKARAGQAEVRKRRRLGVTQGAGAAAP